MNPISVSVITPVYNSAPYLDRLLDSLLGQTLENAEYIFINDCSTDESAEVISRYARDDARIILLNNEKNSGPAFSRNRGLEIARGEYIGFVDSDDWVDAKYFELLYRTAKEEGADVAKGSFVTVMSEGPISRRA